MRNPQKNRTFVPCKGRVGDTSTFHALVSSLGTTQKARRPLHEKPEFVFHLQFLLTLFAGTARPPPPSSIIPTLLDPPSLTDNRVHLPRFPDMLEHRGVGRTRGDVQGEGSLKNARCRVLPGVLPARLSLRMLHRCRLNWRRLGVGHTREYSVDLP